MNLLLLFFIFDSPFLHVLLCHCIYWIFKHWFDCYLFGSCCDNCHVMMKVQKLLAIRFVCWSRSWKDSEITKLKNQKWIERIKISFGYGWLIDLVTIWLIDIVSLGWWWTTYNHHFWYLCFWRSRFGAHLVA